MAINDDIEIKIKNYKKKRAKEKKYKPYIKKCDHCEEEIKDDFYIYFAPSDYCHCYHLKCLAAYEKKLAEEVKIRKANGINIGFSKTNSWLSKIIRWIIK